MESPLNISITPNPTRQTFWRVFGVAIILFFAWVLVSGINRLIHQYDSVVAAEQDTNIRIVRSPRAIHQLKSMTGQYQVIPGVPQSLANLLEATHRVLRIRFSPDGNTTVILDRAIDDSTATAWQTYGATVTRVDDHFTILSTTNPFPINRSTFQGIRYGLGFSQQGTLSQGGETIPFSFEMNKITFNGPLLQPALVDETQTNDTLFSATLNAKHVTDLSSQTITQNTPGLTTLFSLAAQQGISAHLEKQGNNIRYTFALPLANSTQTTEEALTTLAEEIVEIPTIQGITSFLDDGTRTQILRSREEAVLVVRNESPYRFITAATANATAYITQTPDLLTVSNHASAIASASTSNTCLPGAIAFVKPRDLSAYFFAPSTYQPSLLAHILWDVNTIASTKTTSRICL
jgi:hypothetical protein